MFAFKDLFPRAFEVLTQDVELKESEKIALVSEKYEFHPAVFQEASLFEKEST